MTPGDCCCGHSKRDHANGGMCVGGDPDHGGECECEGYERYLGPFDGDP